MEENWSWEEQSAWEEGYTAGVKKRHGSKPLMSMRDLGILKYPELVRAYTKGFEEGYNREY